MSQEVLLVLIAGLLPVVCAGIAKWGARTYDNHNPRAWMAQQEGRRARADAAQSNSLEAFPFFAAAVVLAMLQEVDPDQIALWGWVFIAMRVAYIYCYVTDRASMRSIVWTLGLLAVLRLYALAL